MSTAPSLSSQSKWTMLSGPMKGAVQEITRPLMVIGRSSECDIVIVNDPKCSRKHAKVELTNRGFEIQSLSASNALKVNKEAVQSTVLKDGDVIGIGDTEIRFNATLAAPSVARDREPSIRTQSGVRPMPSPAPSGMPSAPPTGWPLQVVPVNSAQPVSPYDYSRPAAPPPPRPSSGSNKGRFYLYGGVALVVAFLFFGESPKKKPVISLRTAEQIDQDIESAKKLQQAAEDLRRRNNQNPSFEMRQAQENYVKGFRDFRKGQYERALESFQACLSLAPEHVLCNRYLRLSQRKFDELIQYHMVLGRKYRDQEQYRACRAAFRNVMVMVKDPASTIYKEARANFEACNSFVEGNF